MKRPFLWTIATGICTALLAIALHSFGFDSSEFPARAQEPLPPVPTPTEVQPLPPAPPLPAPTLPIQPEPYKDPAGLFQIALLDGYKSHAAAGATIVESPDGNLAYTVVVRQRARGNLDAAALAQIAIEVFQQGEGFRADLDNLEVVQQGQRFSPAALGLAPEQVEPIPEAIVLPWTGSLRQGRSVQAIAGKIYALQSGRKFFLLLVSATEAERGRVEDAIETLRPTLQPL